MEKYYKLKLNCARTKKNSCMDDIINCGYISCFPVVKTEESLLGKDIKMIEYSGLGYVIAEKKDNYFEEIIFGNKIYYNPQGIRDTENLKFVSNKRLINELDSDITCFAYDVASTFEIASFINQIQNNRIMLKRYKDELDYVLNKDLIKEELEKRGVNIKDLINPLEIINEFKKVRSL